MIVHIETLGCSRNQVDSEIMLGRLVHAGHTSADDPSQAEVIVVNTCGFISTASEEAVDVLLDMARYKKEGRCTRLIATGCLAQRYKDDKDLASSLPEVDAFLGTGACDLIVDVVENRASSALVLFPDPNKRGFQDLSILRELSQEKFAYVKVSEGCDRHCTYCIIPELRGRQRSRPGEDIEKEAEILLSKGIKEIILTAENTTDYGRDLSEGTGFSRVLARTARTMAARDETAWLRFLYTHPSSLDLETIETVRDHANICSYYDVPIQHASSAVLKRMGRPYTRENLKDLFKLIRKTDPEAVLRTTLIVGFPGETQKDFKILLEFIHEIGFDHLGVFTYSDSEDLASHRLGDPVSAELAEQRHDQVMAAQAGISLQVNEKHVGRVYPVMVEENPEPGVYIGRTMFQAPEVDGVTFIYSDGLEIGTRFHVKITDAYEYDIAGEIA
ncbi:30S ribosomal protein S12 methylthiotransferase RimO [Desulfospira joergensenii]|uniref:30S ribosomal protein S12 methylthiotransferase RimO n=1 Tax=Desulfospira joergensenii TaxID=53329 RepID=UPI0003B756E2|nr:30S ribosomal protein S12 methylthiotransferase RimO [Desulfospira joergensenii]